MQQQHCFGKQWRMSHTVQYSTEQYSHCAHVVLSLEDKGELKLKVV